MIAGIADTHTAIWYLFSDERLGRGASAFIDATIANGVKDLSNVTAPFAPYTVAFTGTGSDVLTFSSEDLSNFLSLDDVSLATVPSAAPELSSLLLLGTGICGLAAVVRRRLFNA